MTSEWTPVDSNHCFALVKCGFYPSEDLLSKFQGMLVSLHLGDNVKIKAENGNWALILNLSSLETGLVPKSYLFETPFEGHRYGFTLIRRPIKARIFQEASDVLQEWHKVLIRLYLHHTPEFQQNLYTFKCLFESHQERLRYKNLTKDGRKKITKEIRGVIDEGNKQLGLDVRARNRDGSELQPGSMSMVEYFQRYCEWVQVANSTLWTEDSSENVRNTQGLFALSMTVTGISGAIPGHGLKFFLYDGKAVISESASFYIADQLQTRLKVMFTDLDQTDNIRAELYLAATIFRYGPMDSNKDNSGRTTLRRPCGAALSNITHVLREQRHGSYSCHLTYLPFTESDKSLGTILEKLKNGSQEPPSQWDIKLEMSLVQEASYEASRSVFVPARKISFPSIILPTDCRNELYVTLDNGVFQKGSVEVTVTMHHETEGLLEEPLKHKVPQFTSSVYPRDPSPEWAETFAISLPETLQDLASTYLRLFFTFRETDEDLNAKPFGFAFLPLYHNCATAVKDGSYSLAVYKIEHSRIEKAKFKDFGIPWLKEFASTKKHTTALAFNNRSSIFVKTKLCSTMFTQDERLSDFLRFKTSSINPEEIESPEDLHKNLLDLKLVLLGLRTVQGMEVAKFLQQILEKLFNLLGSLSNEYIGRFKDPAVENDQHHLVFLQCETEIFMCLNHFLEFGRTDKFRHFTPVIDDYIHSNFSASLACKKVLHGLVAYLLPFPHHEYSGRILHVIDNIEMLFRFAVRSYKILEKMVYQGLITQEQTVPRIKFSGLVGEYFGALKTILNQKKYSNVRAAILKTVPGTMELLSQIYPSWRLINYWTQIVDSVQKQNRLEALGILTDIVNSSLFLQHDARTLIMFPLRSSILPHLDFRKPTYENARESDPDLGAELPLNYVLQLADKSVKLLGNVLRILHRTDIGSVEDNILCLALTILKPILLAVIEITSTGGTWSLMFKTDMVSILLSFFSGLKPHHWLKILRESWGREHCNRSALTFRSTTCSNNVEQLESHQGNTQRSTNLPAERPDKTSSSFVETLSTCLQKLYTSDHYPAAWSDIIFLQNKIILQVLHVLAELLKSEFSAPIQVAPWLAFFNCATAFLIQPSLQLEQFSPSKVFNLVKRFGDMRSEAAELVLNIWRSLEAAKKRQFSRGKYWTLLRPFLQMTLVPEPNIRASGISVFFDMIREEFRISVPPQNFKQVEKQFIQNLTELVGTGMGDEGYSEIFDEIMSAKFNEDETGMRDQGLLFVKTVKRFLQVLLDLRKCSNEANAFNRMTCYARLMELSEELDDKDLYIRFLYKLYVLQKQEQRYTEAAFVLERHCRLLYWSEESLASYLESPLHPSVVTHMVLKEALYEDRISHLRKAQMFECALELLSELYQLYREKTFEHDKLQRILQEMTNCVNSMHERKSTIQPNYFRVGFYGRGFPYFLRDKEYIYLGKQFEQLAAFEKRILDIYPYAEMIRTVSPPSEQITESKNQYLQVYAVKPVPGFCQGLPTASLRAIQYYSRNHVDTFTFDRRIPVKRKDGADNEFANLYLQRTSYTISSAFPGVLSWFPVIMSSLTEVRPIENAIEFLEWFKDELRTLILEQYEAFYTNGKYTCTKNLQGRLKGVLDSAVQGGIPKYEEAFLTSAYLKKNSGDQETVSKLKDAIISLVPIVREGLRIHGIEAKEAADMQEMLQGLFEQFCKHISETYRVNTEHLNDSYLQKVVAKYSKRIQPELVLVVETAEEVPEIEPSRGTMEPRTIESRLSRAMSTLALTGTSRQNSRSPTPGAHPRRPTLH